MKLHAQLSDFPPGFHPPLVCDVPLTTPESCSWSIARFLGWQKRRQSPKGAVKNTAAPKQVKGTRIREQWAARGENPRYSDSGVQCRRYIDAAIRLFPRLLVRRHTCFPAGDGPWEVHLLALGDGFHCWNPRRARATFPMALCVSRPPTPALRGAWLLSGSTAFLSQGSEGLNRKISK